MMRKPAAIPSTAMRTAHAFPPCRSRRVGENQPNTLRVDPASCAAPLNLVLPCVPPLIPFLCFAVVRTQVESQIKVRDFSRAQVTLSPADFTSWGEARAELVTEAKRPLKAQQQAELAAAASEEVEANIRAAFAAREKAIEHEIDHKPMEANIELSISYNFLSK